MKTLQIIALTTVIVAGLVVLLSRQTVTHFGGIPTEGNQIRASATNNSSTPCARVSGLIIATDTARTSFMAAVPTLTGVGEVTICRAASCVNGTAGIILSSSTWGYYEQNDNYIGPYSCISNGTTTIGITYSE